VPGNKAPSVAASATSLDLLGLASLPAGPGRVSIQAGFRLDRSAKSVDNIARLSLQDRVSLGVSDYNELIAGAQLSIPAGKAWLGAELSAEAFVGSPPTGSANLNEGSLLMRAGVTAGTRVADQWELVAFVEGAKVPGVQAVQVQSMSIPIIPYEPVISGGIGLIARFGGDSKRLLTKQLACWETAEGCKPDERPLLVEVEGTVVDDTGKPMVGAKVSLQGHVYTGAIAPTITDAKGEYRFKDVQVGRRVTTPSQSGAKTEEKVDETSLDVAVELSDKKPGSATIEKPHGGTTTVPPIELLPAVKPGELKGVVRTQAGKAIDKAIVTVSPGDKKTETGADGTFAMDLPPGHYKVTVKAPGTAPQELDVTIDPDGVALKEFVLRTK
jgi:hypothetical protein